MHVSIRQLLSSICSTMLMLTYDILIIFSRSRSSNASSWQYIVVYHYYLILLGHADEVVNLGVGCLIASDCEVAEGRSTTYISGRS